MQRELELDYIDALRIHLRLTEMLYFDRNKNGLTDREENFLLLCMHIKLNGYIFQSQEAFMLFDVNGYQNSKYLYWNDRILPKGWFTDKLYRDKGDADLTPYLGLATGKKPTKIKYDLQIKFKVQGIDAEKGTGYFRGFPQ